MERPHISWLFDLFTVRLASLPFICTSFTGQVIIPVLLSCSKEVPNGWWPASRTAAKPTCCVFFATATALTQLMTSPDCGSSLVDELSSTGLNGHHACIAQEAATCSIAASKDDSANWLPMSGHSASVYTRCWASVRRLKVLLAIATTFSPTPPVHGQVDHTSLGAAAGEGEGDGESRTVDKKNNGKKGRKWRA